MTDHADTIRAVERLREWLTTDNPAPSYAWTDPDVLIPDVAALLAERDALLAERQQLHEELDGMARAPYGQYQAMRERAEKAEAERQQAIDALRRAREDVELIAKTTFDMGMDGRIRRAERSCERIDAALVKLGEKP